MPMAPKTDAEKAAKLREMAKDKSLPQPVRNQYLDDANKLEEKAAKKAGVNLAKGGMAKKKYAVGGMSSQIPLSDVPRQPATPKTATPDRFKTMGEMARRAVANKQALTKPQVNVQPKPRVGPTTKPQVNVQPKPRVAAPFVDKQVNVQPRMAKGGAVAKKAKK